MLCYLVLNGIYRSYLLAEGYETERHFFESLTAYCKIQVREGCSPLRRREGSFFWSIANHVSPSFVISAKFPTNKSIQDMTIVLWFLSHLYILHLDSSKAPSL